MLAENTDGVPAADGDVPQKPVQRYLQTHYTIGSEDFDKRIAIDDPGDGSTYTLAYRRYNPLFRNLVQRFGWDDFMLVDTDGNIVYSAYKGVDFGTNLVSGPYAVSALSKALTDARASSVEARPLKTFQFETGVTMGN